MKIFNLGALESGTATVLVIHTFIPTLAELARHNYKSKLAEAGLETNQVCYLSLFDQKPSKIGVVELRLKMLELEELLKVSNINVIVDCTSSYDEKLKKYSSGLIFSKIFGKDVSLWNSRGVFVHKGGAGSFKWLCGFRSESAGREAGKKQVVDSEFVVDFDKANIITITDGIEAKEVFRKLYAENEAVFYDTETSCLRWEQVGAKVLTVQLTGNSDKNTSYVFAIDHKDIVTTNNLKKVVGQGLKWILESGKKIFIHNSNFDILWTRKHLCPDLDFYKVNIWDTMIIYHFLTNSIYDVKLGLKESAFITGTAQDWESDLGEAKKEICARDKLKLDDFSYELFEPEMLIRYAGLDTIVLAYYWDMLKRLNEEHPARVEVDIIQETWKDNWQSIMQSIEYQIWVGMPFDIKVAKKQLKEHNETIIRLTQEILDDENTKKAMRLVNSRNFEKAKLAYQKKCEEAQAKGKEFKGAKPDFALEKYGSISFVEEFNPASLAHKRILFFEVLNLPILGKTDGGAPACGAGEMLEYCDKFPQHKVLANFGQITKINKECGTYLEPFIELAETAFDGRIRTNFVPLNKSLRMRASAPTLLNLPKTDFKKCVQEANGNFIYQIDYSALEAILSLNSTEDEARLAQYLAGVQDIHSVNAIIAGKAVGDIRFEKFDVTKPEDIAYVKSNFPKERQDAKGSLTFLLQYLGSYLGIKAGLKVTDEVAKNIYNGYWDTYLGEKKFIIEATRKMSTQGYIKFFGSGVILTPDIELDPFEPENLKKIRTPFNAIHQSGAFLTLQAMDRVQRRFFGTEGFMPFVSVYDSAIYSCRDEDAIAIREAFLEEMTKPYKDKQRVMLKADSEIGSSYKAERAFEGTNEELVQILKEMRNK